MTINEALDYIHAVDWRRSSLGLSRIDDCWPRWDIRSGR